MDITQWLFYLFAGVSTVYVVHFGLYLIGANIYDIWQYRRHYRDIRPPRARRTRGYTTADGRHYAGEIPGLVSVCIAAHNEEPVITRSLDSIRRSRYKNIEVLVADDASHDATRQLVRDYMLRHPEMRLRVYRMRKNVGKGMALSTVMRRYARGQYVMTLDADSLITPDTIGNALSYFSDPSVAGVAANVQVIDEPTVLGILQKFEHMIGYRSKKMYSILNCEFVVGGVASTYRMRILREVNFYDNDTVTEDIGLSTKIVYRGGNHTWRMVYGSDVVAMTEGVSTLGALMRQRYRWKYGSMQNLVKYRRLILNPSDRYSRVLTWYRMPMAVVSEFMLALSPLAWTYALYMSITQYDAQLMVGAYATITAYTLITIWFDENLKRRHRLKLTLYAPVAYFIFYLMDLVQLVAIGRCLIKANVLLKQKNVGSTWVSPKRTGNRLAVPHEV